MNLGIEMYTLFQFQVTKRRLDNKGTFQSHKFDQKRTTPWQKLKDKQGHKTLYRKTKNEHTQPHQQNGTDCRCSSRGNHICFTS